MKKVAIFVPLAFPFGMVPQEFFLSFFYANEYLLSNIKEDIQLKMFSPSTFPIDANRNECAAELLEGGFDTSIWLDADQELARDTLYRLLVEGDGYPIYSGIYYLKKPPKHPIVFQAINDDFSMFNPIWNYPLNNLFYADMIGMGCVKIDREVFEAVDAPFFKYQQVPKELADKSERMAFKRRNRVDDVSEDVYFWKQVKQKTDYRIVVDPAIQIGHITKHVVTPEEAIQTIFINRRVSKQRDGEKFDKWWNENFQPAEIVNPNGEETKYLFDEQEKQGKPVKG